MSVYIVQEAATHVGSVYLLADVFLVAMNLDFFRNVLPDICLALDYLIAVYPMIVTVFAFFILQLHYHGCGPVLLICRPFQRMFARFRQGWNLYTHITHWCLHHLLCPVNYKDFSCVNQHTLEYPVTHDAEGNNIGYFWYEDASIKFIHKPYAILAISVLLLCLYISLLVGWYSTILLWCTCTRCYVHYSFLLWSHTDINTSATTIWNLV